MIKKLLAIAFYAVAAAYVFLMLDLLFRIGIISSGKAAAYGYNLIPLKTIWEYVSGANGVSKARAVQNILGNIAMFIPYGLYVQVLLKNKRFGKSLLIVVGTSVLIEMIQLIFGLGACDVDDVLLNACGGVVGIAGYKLLQKLFPEPEKTKTAITLISLVVGMPILFIYLKALLYRFH